MADFEVISGKKDLLGENPLWDIENGELWWTDIIGKMVYSYNPVKGIIRERLSGLSVSSFAFIKGGGLICGCLEGLYHWSENGGFIRIADIFDGEALTINDGIADARGRFLFGTNYYDEKRSDYRLGKLFSFDGRTGILSVLDEGVHLSNGLGFSSDNSIIYYTDTVARVIFRYRYDPEKGSVSGKEVFVKVPENEGIPDGLTVDSEDFVWSAQWYGECIVRYDPDGAVWKKIAVPAKQVTSLVFGGDELSDIYVTSASKVWRSPLAPPGYDYNSGNTGGSLYRCNFGIRGRPENFAVAPR